MGTDLKYLVKVSLASMLILASAEYASCQGLQLKEAITIDTNDDCGRVGDTFLIDVDGQQTCIAYYKTARIEQGADVVVYIHGDHSARDPVSRQREFRSFWSIIAQSFIFSARTNIPSLVLSRPGFFGSGGRPEERHRIREYELLNKALDRVKQELNVKKFHLVGQSAGANAVLALLTLGRKDISCTVASSGVFAYFDWQDYRATKEKRPSPRAMFPGYYAAIYDTSKHLSGIPLDGERRIFVLSDPADKWTSYELQKKVVEKIRAMGHHAVMISAEGDRVENHDLSDKAFDVAESCVKNKTDAEIIARITK